MASGHSVSQCCFFISSTSTVGEPLFHREQVRWREPLDKAVPRVPEGPLRITSESLESCCIRSQKEQYLRLNPLHKIHRATGMIYFLHLNRRAHLYILSSFSKKIAKKESHCFPSLCTNFFQDCSVWLVIEPRYIKLLCRCQRVNDASDQGFAALG